MNEDLKKALSSIEGVERSEVDLVDDGPLGIRIRLSRDADRRAVADSVQRLLEAPRIALADGAGSANTWTRPTSCSSVGTRPAG